MTTATTAQKKTSPRPKVQDHKKPAPKAVDGFYTVTMKGHKFRIAEDAIDDFELLDELSQIQDGAAQKVPSAMRRFLGKDQYGEALDLVRDKETGRVGVQEATEFFFELLGELDPNS